MTLLIVADVLVHALLCGVLVGALLFGAAIVVEQVQQMRGDR